MNKERCNCDASCGENRYHDYGSRGCRYEGLPYEDVTKVPRKPPTYQNGSIQIPLMAPNTNPEDYQMILKVSEAIKVNEDLIRLQQDNIRMKAQLINIFHNSIDPQALRRAAIGLGWSEK